MNNDVYYPPQIIDDFAKLFADRKAEWIYRIKVKGKYVRLATGKSSWSTLSAAKNAFRVFMGRAMSINSYYTSEHSLFVKHGLARIDKNPVTNLYGQVSYRPRFVAYHNEHTTEKEMYLNFIEFLQKEKILEFVKVEDDTL